MERYIQEIGTVRSRFKEKADPFEMRKWESTLAIRQEFEDGLYRLEESPYIQVVFGFHRADEYRLQQKTYSGQVKGVFASRSPRRPSSIGITTVKLLKREGTTLHVKGLDAIDGTPIFDIKPHANVFDETKRTQVAEETFKADPRWEITRLIRQNDRKELLLQAGQLHGHYCPGLAQGILAATDAMRRFTELSDGLEKLLAIVEVNSCFVDGIQFVTGCSLGNNSLIYREFGKTAVTLADRSGKGVRYAVRPDFRERLQDSSPEFQKMFTKVVEKGERTPENRARFKQLAREAAFRLVDVEPEILFFIQEVKTHIPEYARMVDSIICEQCGESVMANRIVEHDRQQLCRGCANAAYQEFNGNGIFLSE